MIKRAWILWHGYKGMDIRAWIHYCFQSINIIMKGPIIDIVKGGSFLDKIATPLINPKK